jgi:uncharacterized repeat protein (TIGR02543 family)
MAIVISAGQACADFNVTISSSASANGAWSNASTDVWTPTATGANVSVADIQTRLNAGTPVVINTTGSGTENGDLTVNGPVSWNTNTILTLTALRNVTITASITATGTSAGLVITPTSGSYILNSSITLSGTTPTLSIAGTAFTIINNVNALQNMGNGNYALGSNIDASATSGWNSGAGFVPISSFTGTFDGLNHTITGMTISRSGGSVGLFGTANTGSVIRNVGLVGGSVTCSGNNSYVGGLVGVNNSATITNAFNTSSVVVYGDSNNAGGLVGRNLSGSVSNSYSAGTVAGTGAIGGLIGFNSTASTITNSFSTAVVSGSGATGGVDCVGGLVGYNSSSSITNSYSTGSVIHSGGGTGMGIGGLVGLNTSASTVTNSYTMSSVNGAGNILYGNNSADSTFSNSSWLTSAQMMTKSYFTNWNFDTIWYIHEGVTNPLLRVFLHTVSYNGNGSTGGTTPTDASNPHLSGATVTVLANTFTRTGYTFAGWYPAADGSGTVYGTSFTMGSTDTTLYATWTINHYSVAGSAGTHGTLDASTPSPATVNYGSTASFTFNADPDYYVSSISGCNGTPFSNSDQAIVTRGYTTGAIDADCTVDAVFTIKSFQLSVSVPSSNATTVGSGTVSSDTGGIVCSSGGGGKCSAFYPYGTPVTLTVTQTTGGSTFTGWTGDCASLGFGQCNVTLTVNKNVAANFGYNTNGIGPLALIGSIGYNTLNDAYAAAGSTATISTIYGDSPIGTMLMDRPVDVTLNGGYNAYGHLSELPTVLLGTLTISNGSIRVSGIRIR